MILKLSLDMPDDEVYVPLTRQFGRGLLKYMNVVKEDIRDVEAIVTELITNVVRHAQSSEGRFQVSLEYYADRVIIIVVDAGNGFAFRDVSEIGSVRSDGNGSERVGGFGLPIIDTLSDKLEFTRTAPQGMTVCAKKMLHYETQKAKDDADTMNKRDGGKAYVSGG
jgi:serine/threonine-protein kinase RsbW